MRWLGRLLAGAVVLLAVCACSSTTAGHPVSQGQAGGTAKADAAAVRQAFQTYTEAALGGDGATAASVVASTVYDFYDGVRRQALTAPADQVRALPTMEEVTVYILRAEVEAPRLQRASSEELIEIAIDKGLIGRQGEGLTIGAVRVTGDSASAEVEVGGQPAPFQLRFVREDGRWKLDMTTMLDIGRQAFTGLAAQQGITEDQLVDGLITRLYGPAKVAQLREPLR